MIKIYRYQITSIFQAERLIKESDKHTRVSHSHILRNEKLTKYNLQISTMPFEDTINKYKKTLRQRAGIGLWLQFSIPESLTVSAYPLSILNKLLSYLELFEYTICNYYVHFDELILSTDITNANCHVHLLVVINNKSDTTIQSDINYITNELNSYCNSLTNL